MSTWIPSKPVTFLLITLCGFLVSLSVYRVFMGKLSSLGELSDLYNILITNPLIIYDIPTDKKFECVNSTSKRMEDVWQRVGDVYVFSAFYESEKRVVQIVAIARRNTKAICSCGFHNDRNSLQETVTAYLEIIPEHHNRMYSPAILSCRLGNRTSYHVVTVSCKAPNNASLPIIRPIETPHVSFTVCFPALQSNYANIHQMVQTIAMNRILGAQRFVMYDHSMHPLVRQAVDLFVANDLLEVIPWKVPVSDIHYFAQLAAAQDCLYRNRYRSTYIVFQDLDEIIVPKQNISWNNLLQNLTEQHPDAGTFVFRHSYFPRWWPDSNQNSSHDHVIKSRKLYLLTKFLRHTDIMGWNKRSKFIVIPRRTRILGIHQVPVHEVGYKNVTVDSQVALLHHYRSITPNTKMRTKDTTLIRYTRQLIEKITEIWTCLD